LSDASDEDYTDRQTTRSASGNEQGKKSLAPIKKILPQDGPLKTFYEPYDYAEENSVSKKDQQNSFQDVVKSRKRSHQDKVEDKIPIKERSEPTRDQSRTFKISKSI
jgi:hypothetical protein